MTWRDDLCDTGRNIDDATRATLMDTDLRIRNLPVSRVATELSEWLDRVACGLIKDADDQAQQPAPAAPGSGDQTADAMLQDLRVHVLEAETNFRSAPAKYSIIWIAGLLIWIVIIPWLWDGAATFFKPDEPLLGVSVRAWMATFIAGVAGSVTMVLSKIYRGTFAFHEISFTPRTSELTSRYSTPIAKPIAITPQGLAGLVAQFWERLTATDIVRVFFRAVVRPILGGVLAVAVMLIFMSGFVAEPLVTSLIEDHADPIDFVDAKTSGFFLSIAFLAGFSEDLAWTLLDRAVARLSGTPSNGAT